MIKFFYLNLFIFLSLLPAYGQNGRFPYLELDDCNTLYITNPKILECEKNNALIITEAIEKFYPRVREFFPKDYQEMLDQSQMYWDKLVHTDCKLSANVYDDPIIQEIRMLNCINQQAEKRIQDLIYTVVLWEDILGNFQ